jgi:ribosomal protein S21
MTKDFKDEREGLKEQTVDAQDAELDEALRDFKSSVYAWSDAAYFRPRVVTREVRGRNWRLATGWALGCVLAAGSVSGGLYERHHRREMEKMAAEQRAAEQRLREQQAKAAISDEALLADVDSAVSRQVPSAMEPLAQLMSDDGTK